MARPNVGNKKSSHKNLSNKSPFRTATLWLIWGWLLIFALLPNILVIAVSFLTRDSTAFISLPVTLDSYVRMIDPLYFDVFVHSLWMAGITTVICLLLGYPFAWFVSRVDKRWQPLLMLMLILPFWTNSLVRTYALKLLFASNGLINKSLLTLGIIDAPIDILYTQGAVIAGLTYLLFPFMVLPLYANLSKMDVRLLEAAYDLGANPWKAFWMVTVPLSRAGIIAGCMLVFIPALGEFVIPSLLGGAENIMIGRVVWDEMFAANNWPRAAALAVVMIVMILVPLAAYYYYSAKQDALHGD